MSDGATAPLTHRAVPIAVAAATVMVVAGLGGLATDVGPWYQALIKPWFQPPDWLFGPAWTIIYTTTAVAGVKAWSATNVPSIRRTILLLFSVNFVLNILWSVLFFTFQRPDWAAIQVWLLWASIAALLFAIRRISSAAAWWLAPYLLWVSFAAVLNIAVVELNRPFGHHASSAVIDTFCTHLCTPGKKGPIT
jgi:translocator protein